MLYYLLSAAIIFSARFVYFKVCANYRHSVFTRTYLSIACNTLNNDADRFRADCFLGLTRFQLRLHYAFSSSKLEQDAKQFASMIFLFLFGSIVCVFAEHVPEY